MSDVWDCIRMVNLIGEFTTKSKYSISLYGESYCEIKWGFEIPYSKSSNHDITRDSRFKSISIRKVTFIGDKEFLDFTNLVKSIRLVTKISLNRNPQNMILLGDLEYINGDFSNDLAISHFNIYFEKVY